MAKLASAQLDDLAACGQLNMSLVSLPGGPAAAGSTRISKPP
jgi:hypothetical protein